MMKASALQTIVLPTAIVIAGFGAVFGLSRFIENRRPALPDGYADTDLSLHGSRLKGFALGMEGLMADWYFMRSLQYVGDKLLSRKDESLDIDNLRDLNPRLLYPLLDNATDLDPHFIAAYTYGAIILPAIDPDKAIGLAEKGIAKNPNQWQIYQQLGYIYWKLGRYDKAAETYESGSQIAGSPPFMKLMAATMKSEGGSRSTARAIYRDMYAGSADEQIQITAMRRLLELDSLDEREAIDRVLSEFRERNGRCPNGFGEITPMLLQVKLPENKAFRIDNANRLIDPTDAAYLLDSENCRVKLDAAKTGLPSQNRER